MHARIIAASLFFMLTTTVQAQDSEYSRSQTYAIEGTEFAQLQSVTDILTMLPEVNVADDGITIVGRGALAIFIGNRKVTELSELMHIKADRVKEITVLRYPGAEYGKDVESVLVIHLKPHEAEGFSLDNSLRLELTHKLSTNNDLTLRWRRKALNLGAFLGWSESRRLFNRKIFSDTFKDTELLSEDRFLVHTDIKRKWFTARLSAAYSFGAKNTLSFHYSYIHRDIDQMFVPEMDNLLNQPVKRHDFAVDYSDQIGRWNLSVGNNSFVNQADYIETNPTNTSNSLRDQYDLRTYAKATSKAGNGQISFGAEHELDHMNLRIYDDNPSSASHLCQYNQTHAVIPEHILSTYVSFSQQWGRWNVEAGLRYEHRHANYTPQADDGLMNYIDDIYSHLDHAAPDKHYYMSMLLEKRQLTYKDDDFYPSLSISTLLGDSHVSLQHTKNSIHPFLGITRLRLENADYMHEKILWREAVSATTLNWKYQWTTFAASYLHYDYPICSTVSSNNKFNAPAYDAVDLDLTLAPKIGAWTPLFLAHLHKQWFDMPVADGKTKLKNPLASLTFNNTLDLSKGWLLCFNAQWHSKGASRNIYYYRSDYSLDASFQKHLHKHGLTFILNATNILHGSYNDITCYIQKHHDICQGVRDRNPRVISLTVRYKL